MDLRDSLKKKPGETVEDYATYLLWCGLAPKFRKISILSRILGEKDHVLRYTQDKMKWRDRDLGVKEAGEAGETEAVRIYSEQHHDRWNGLPRKEWIPYLRVPYPDVEAEKIRRAREEQKAKDEAEKANHPDQMRKARFDQILDDAEISLAKRLAKGDINVNIADLERIEKMRSRESQRKRDSVMMEQAPKESIAQSDRVMRAKANNADVTAALAEDIEELAVILGALREQQAEGGKVLQFKAVG